MSTFWQFVMVGCLAGSLNLNVLLGAITFTTADTNRQLMLENSNLKIDKIYSDRNQRLLNLFEKVSKE